MTIHLLGEGKEDLQVIRQILYAYHVQNAEILELVPNLQFDEMDLAAQDASKLKGIGTFQGVKNECIEKERLNELRQLEDQFYVVQLDTAEWDQQGLPPRPPKSKSGLKAYSESIRGMLITEVQNWLGDFLQEGTFLYAIAVEEIEAWLLTAVPAEKTPPKGKVQDTAGSADPKKQLQAALKGSEKSALVEKFSKKKNLKDFRQRNRSLDLFLNDLEQHLPG